MGKAGHVAINAKNKSLHNVQNGVVAIGNINHPSYGNVWQKVFSTALKLHHVM